MGYLFLTSHGRSCGQVFLTIGEFFIMENKKEKRPSKKELVREIMGLTDLFNMSVDRMNIENLITLKELLEGIRK
jgi:hypothetical protein